MVYVKVACLASRPVKKPFDQAISITITACLGLDGSPEPVLL